MSDGANEVPPQQQLTMEQLKEIQKLLLGGAPMTPASDKSESIMYSSWSDLNVAEGDENKLITCPRCPSKICLPGAATFVIIDKKMGKFKVGGPEEEVIKNFWRLGSLMSFENIGVSHIKDNTKFLSCADCEVGPIGWHDINDKTKFYIAAERVRYVQ